MIYTFFGENGLSRYFITIVCSYRIAGRGAASEKKCGCGADFRIVCTCGIAAEQKARSTYDNLLRLIDDPDVREPLKFLREREVVHFQRFGDALSVVQSNLDAKNYYAWNPAFDVRPRERSAPAPSRPYPMQNGNGITAPRE